MTEKNDMTHPWVGARLEHDRHVGLAVVVLRGRPSLEPFAAARFGAVPFPAADFSADVLVRPRLESGEFERVRDAGASDVRSSGNLVSRFYSRWSEDGLASHRRASRVLADTARDAFAHLARTVRGGDTITEGQLKTWVLAELERRGTGVGADCIIANTVNAADPHYDPQEAGAELHEGDLVLLAGRVVAAPHRAPQGGRPPGAVRPAPPAERADLTLRARPSQVSAKVSSSTPAHRGAHHEPGKPVVRSGRLPETGRVDEYRKRRYRSWGAQVKDRRAGGTCSRSPPGRRARACRGPARRWPC